MIVGTGIDIIEIHRIDEMVKKWGPRFLEKVFTENEIRYCSQKAFASQHYAVRFSAKEAFFKAASHLPDFHFNWKFIEIKNTNNGKPYIEVFEPIRGLFEEIIIHLSLSHSSDTAIAEVVFEKK